MNRTRSARLSTTGAVMVVAGIACFLWVWFSTPMEAIDVMENGGPDAPPMTDAEFAAAMASPVLVVTGLALFPVGLARRQAKSSPTARQAPSSRVYQDH
ncbi:hypothetical protein [Kytococcus sp. Marseille-QA3725]